MNQLNLLLASCAVMVLATTATAADFTVAPNGKDTNPGTRILPYATLERARDAVRELKARGPWPRGGVTIEVRAGSYQLAQPLALTAADSGTPEGPVVWRAESGKEVRLVGGRFVTGWQKVTDPAVLARLDPAARGQVWQADLRAQGITQYGEMKSARGWGSSEAGLELFFNDQPTTLARWPNEGFTTVRDVVVKDFDAHGAKGSRQPRFYYEGDRPSRWANEPEPMVHGYWFWDWADQRYRVKSIDPATSIMTLDTPGGTFRRNQWYYAYNLLCELDMPGEWYLDRAAGRLYFWPPSPLDGAKVMVSLLPSVVTTQNTSHVTFQGFTMEGCQGTAVSMAGGECNRVVRCVIRNTGSFAVRVEGGRAHGVVGCDMYQMGDGGVVLHGGDKKTLTHCEHYAENNHIHHYSRWNPMYKVGIEMFGVGARASHNLVHHAPHVGISFCGQEHVIEYNEIHNVVQHANDAGAIYTQPGVDEDWTMRGHVVRYNFVHHIYGFRGKGCMGVYLDDCFSSMHCYGNVFYQVPHAVFIGGGRDNITENNLFYECNPAIHVDARGLGWAKGIEQMCRQRLAEVPYQQPPWSTRYPQLLTILNDDPLAPKGNVFRRNINWGGKWDDIEGKARPMVTIEQNLLDQDPLVVDVQRLDFRLRPDSPAAGIGFKPIPFDQIGLVNDGTRASWPVRHVVDPAPAGAPKPAPMMLRHATPVTVPRLATAPAVGTAWNGVALQLKDTNEREPITGAPCSARVAHDGSKLYVAVTIPVKRPAGLNLAGTWGASDGLEVCFRDSSDAKKPGPIWVVQGYPNGVCRGVDHAGAPAAAAEKLGQACTYRAQIGTDSWTAEFAIPLASAGITVRPGLKLGFNIGVRRTETDEWVAWAGTLAPNWALDGAGVLLLQ